MTLKSNWQAEDRANDATELESLVVDITEDGGATAEEANEIIRIALDCVSKDQRVKVKSKGKEELWIYHK